MKRLFLFFVVGSGLVASPVRAQFVTAVSGEPVTTYDPGNRRNPPSVLTEITAAPLPGSLNLTGIGAADAFTVEFRAPAGEIFSFTPEAGSPDASLFFLFRWFQFGVNIGGTPATNMLTGESVEWINPSAGAPALTTSAFAFYQSSNNGSNIQVDANASLSAPFTFEGLRFRATWAVNPNDVSVDWFEGGWAQFSDNNYTAPTVTPLVTLEAAPAPVPEPRDAGIAFAGALGLLVAWRLLARRRAQRIEGA